MSILRHLIFLTLLIFLALIQCLQNVLTFFSEDDFVSFSLKNYKHRYVLYNIILKLPLKSEK